MMQTEIDNKKFTMISSNGLGPLASTVNTSVLVTVSVKKPSIVQ